MASVADEQALFAENLCANIETITTRKIAVAS
jgi:hypothetical protein